MEPNQSNKAKLNLPVVYEYRKFSHYFSDYMAERGRQEPRFSYRWLAKKLGLASPSRLSMLASGQRLPNEEFVEKLLGVLTLCEEEIAYCHLMVLQEKSKDVEKRAFYLEKMDTLRPPTHRHVLDETEFTLYESWFLPVILEMLALAEFNPTPVNIAARLEGRISADEAQTALEKLHRQGLAYQDQDGRYHRRYDWTQTGHFAHSKAIMDFHETMAEMGRQAIRTEPPNERYLSGMTLPIDPSKIPEARRLFLNLERQLLELLESGKKSEVYFLHLHLFPMTHTR